MNKYLMTNWINLQLCLKIAEERPYLHSWYIAWAEEYAWKIERFFSLKKTTQEGH